jgi:hypothetical protein
MKSLRMIVVLHQSQQRMGEVARLRGSGPRREIGGVLATDEPRVR